MDYLPPERPVLIAQVRTEDRRHAGKIVDTGQIDQMLLLDDFLKGVPSDEESARMRKPKPGQYFQLCQAEDDSEKLVFYIQEHKPCSVPSFAAFVAMTKLNPVRLGRGDDLNDKQLASLKEILGEKLDSSKYTVNAHADEVEGRKALYVTTVSKQKPATIGSAFYIVSDAKSRIVEEVGFKGAKKDNNRYWLDEAYQMLASLKFVKEKDSAKESKPAGSR
ncbi:MAG: hypothetical protein K2X27_22295 [Candidatus Obscuribacterales bacterium]|nr:hypothetical protein [Candidatus Obscuribacterales bacterium]